MADNIQESTRSIAKLPTRLAVNTDTGAAILYVDGGIFGRDTVAEASALGDNWTINDEFVSKYNTRNGTNLNKDQFEQIFARDYQKTLNNDRANLINTHSPYNTKIYLKNTAKIPGVIDPKTGLKTGDTTTTPPTDPTDPDPVDPPLPQDTGAVPTGAEVSLTPLENAENTGGVTSSRSILKYPYQTSEKYDYIQITPFEYEPSITNIQGTLTNFSGLKSANERIQKSLGVKIFLPMTPGISESNSVAWGDDRLNAIQARFGGIAMKTINEAGRNPLNALKDFGSSLLDAGNEFVNQQGLSQFISAYFAGQAVSANLLGRAGVVINPNLELLFQGPKLRSFRYNFKFTPRDDVEAKIIRAIIKTFKKTMAVKRKEGNIFLGAPYVYKLKYVFNGDDNNNQDHPFLNKIKPCALTSFNVNYSPDGSYMTYQDGSMTSYAVDMQFDELEPIYNDDLEENVDSVTMGY